MLNKISDRVGKHLPKRTVKKIRTYSLKQINKLLGRNFFTNKVAKEGITVLDKVLPFGIGAAVGGSMNYIFDKAVIKGSKLIFAE